MTLDTRRTVIIYRDHLLYPSETFVRAQARALQRYAMVYVGSRRVSGLELPEASTYLINTGSRDGQVREVIFKMFGAAPALLHKLRGLDPVLIHAHHGADGFRALPLAHSLRIPLIVTFHGSDATVTDLRYAPSHYGQRRYLANKEVLQRRASLFIGVSAFIGRKLIEQQFPPAKVVVHYIGVDTDLYAPDVGENSLAILFVGRLFEVKGVEYLIRAMADVQKEYPEAELILIGDGPLRGKLEIQAKSSLRRYRFLGAQSPEVVRKWMDQAAIFCGPSVTTHSGAQEAFGMVFAEAQALQKPVVSFASGGIPEAVAHNETGLLAPEYDWRTLAEHISLLLKNPQMRRDFGYAGRRRVLQLFNLRKQTAELEKIYEKVPECS